MSSRQIKNKDYSILIYGAWSIWIYLWSQLLDADYQSVTLYGREKLRRVSDKIKINGEYFDLPTKKFELEYKDYDIIFVTTKLYDTQTAILDIQKFHPNFKYICFIQNGLVESGFYNGLVSHPGFSTISIFEWYRLDNDELSIQKTNMCRQMEDTLAKSFFIDLFASTKIIVKDWQIESSRATKFILNSSVNALSALERSTFGELLENLETKEYINKILREGYNVLIAKYKLWNYDDFYKQAIKNIKEVRRHYSSMYQDVISHRPTEVHFLNWLIKKWWEEQNIPTPTNNKIYSRFLIEIWS